MSFEQEWVEAKRDANRDAHMQLAHALPPDSGPNNTGVDLAITPAVKTAVAKHIQETFKPDVAEKARIADTVSEDVCGSGDATSLSAGPAGSLRCWNTGAGLRYGLRQWDKQVKALQARLSNMTFALGYTGKSFAGLESDTKAGLDLIGESGEPSLTPGFDRSKLNIL